MANELVGFVEEYDRALAASAAREQISVLVLGPNITSPGHAAHLRKHIADQCEKDKRITLKGEHKSLIQVFQQHMGEFADLCHYELDLAQRVNALVIIPSSPGSFIELGMFSIIEDICGHSLVLFDRDFEPQANFVKLGAKRAFDNRGAQTAYVDYADKDQAWTIVHRYLQNKRNNKHLKRVLSS